MSLSSITRRGLLRACISATGILVLAPRPAGAQGSWLDKGTKALEGLSGGGSGDGFLSQARIGQGLKEALEVASRTVVDRVGQPGGYLKDRAIHIPLPGFLSNAQPVLQAAGAGDLLDDLELRLNRAAEAAAPKARDIFLQAIDRMTVADARKILDGPDDAATQYFKRTMSPELRDTFRPIVDRELQSAGAVQSFDAITQKIEGVPFAGDLGGGAKDRLVEHGLDGALDGIFHYLAKEEAAIRNNPAKRSTKLLREVFG